MSRVLIYCLLCAFSISLIQPATLKRSPAVFDEIIKTLKNLNNKIKTNTVELHSPRNIPSTCHLSALNCFKNETSLLRQLLDDTPSSKRTLSRIRNFNPPPDTPASDLTCPSCTSYKKQNPRTFVTDFITLLQQMYRVYMDKQ